MFKELKQQIGQGLTAISGRSAAALGQVSHAIMAVCC